MAVNRNTRESETDTIMKITAIIGIPRKKDSTIVLAAEAERGLMEQATAWTLRE
ncbi:MAG: hypothetical protein M0R30_08050 [Methanoregula sp.]|jgi:hypothetical protein|uniref:hypothetical protein n=1 Tax=Methanoregula sp. TaxID=2052170 RepID=UPI0025FC5562|nr:hypothetical protein [Methanoregula sp.]MCK9631582.1 hypothetical protein [Methanoregula sp.]